MTYLERFFQWQNYAHYILLAIGLWLTSEYTQDSVLKLMLVLLIADSIIHGLFWILPKPLRWRD